MEIFSWSLFCIDNSYIVWHFASWILFGMTSIFCFPPSVSLNYWVSIKFYWLLRHVIVLSQFISFTSNKYPSICWASDITLCDPVQCWRIYETFYLISISRIQVRNHPWSWSMRFHQSRLKAASLLVKEVSTLVRLYTCINACIFFK